MNQINRAYQKDPSKNEDHAENPKSMNARQNKYIDRINSTINGFEIANQTEKKKATLQPKGKNPLY